MTQKKRVLLKDEPISKLQEVPEMSYIKDLFNKADRAIEKLKRMLD